MINPSLRTLSVNLKRGDTHEQVSALRKFLVRFGYLPAASSPDAAAAAQDLFDSNLETALKEYQDFHGLLPTGVVDAGTLEMINRPRCGNADVMISAWRTAASDANVTNGKWGHNALEYGFENYTRDLTRDEVQRAFRRAFSLWSAVTPLTFNEVSIDDDPEIRIRFVRGRHGHGDDFIGPGGILAHARSPGRGEGGDICFDENENWIVTEPSFEDPPEELVIDLVETAAHEIGHALGLQHSSREGDLMFPIYSGFNRDLSRNDIRRIQGLYGSEGVETTGITGQTGWPGVRMIPGPYGDPNLDAALIHPRNAKAYFFRRSEYLRFKFDRPEGVDKVGQIGRSGWPGVWSNVDAALVHPQNGKAYFFRGNRYQRFVFGENEHVDKEGVIGRDGWRGVWSNLDAALVHPINGKAYFFREDQYQRFDFETDTVDKTGMIGITGWPGVWGDLDAALVHPRNGKAYFFKGGVYQRFEFPPQ